MNNTTLEGDLTVLHVTQAIHRRLAPLEAFTGQTYPDLRSDVVFRAHVAVLDLRTHRGVTQLDRVAIGAAMQLCDVLFDDLDPPADLWSTPLGADIAWAIGYPRSEVPQWAAAAILNRSRVGVFKAIKQGRLELTAGSVRGFLRQSVSWWQWAAGLVPNERALHLVASNCGHASRSE